MKWEKEYKASNSMIDFIKKTTKLGLKKASAKRTYYKLAKELSTRKQTPKPVARPSRPLPSKTVTTFYKTCNGTPTGKILRITIREMQRMLDMARTAHALAIGVDIVEE